MKVSKYIAGFTIAALVVGVGFGLANRAEAGDVLALGSKAPMTSVTMKGVDGKDHSIASVMAKKGTLVMFSCNACPWVKKWEDRISAIGNEYQKKGIGVIVINSNDPDRVAEDSYDVMIKRAKAKGFDFPYVVDATSDVARAFGAKHTPEAFLFDAEGKLVYHGAIDDNANDAKGVEAHFLKDALNAVITGKAVPMAQTKALGCTIKFRSSSDS